MQAIKTWNKRAIVNLTRDGTLRPDMRLTDPITGWRMPPIGHMIENIGYEADVLFEAMHNVGWDHLATYEIERPQNGRVRTTPLSHLVEFYVARRGRKASTVLFDALKFYMYRQDSPTTLNIPFSFEHVNGLGVPIQSKWSEMSGQSLCAVFTQTLPEPIEFIAHILGSGGRFHAGDPPGLFVLATRKRVALEAASRPREERLEYIEETVQFLIRTLRDNRDYIGDDVVCSIEPRSQQNLLHWMVANCPWNTLRRSQQWLTVLHEYGLSVFKPAGDGRTAMELAASNQDVTDNCLMEALLEMKEKERNVYAMIATTQQAMRGMGLSKDTIAHIHAFKESQRKREAATAEWYDRRLSRAPHNNG
jgi:hypothetical protein